MREAPPSPDTPRVDRGRPPSPDQPNRGQSRVDIKRAVAERIKSEAQTFEKIEAAHARRKQLWAQCFALGAAGGLLTSLVFEGLEILL